MDSYLKLTAAEMRVYNRQLEATEPKERQRIMQMTNSWVEKGRKEGRAEGRAEGRRNLILRLLQRRLGPVPAQLAKQLGTLSDSQLDELGDALLGFSTLADARAWLNEHVSRRVHKGA